MDEVDGPIGFPYVEPRQTFFEDQDSFRARDSAEVATPRPSQSRSRRPSFKRAISLLTENIGRSSTQGVSPGPLATAASHKQSPQKPRKSISQTWGHTRNMSDASDFDFTSPSHYYQDPETRMKLRFYLGSAKKFEEVLEYGFPTQHRADPPPADPRKMPCPSLQAASEGDQTISDPQQGSFFDDDEQSDFSSSDEEDEDDISAVDDASSSVAEDDEGFDADIDSPTPEPASPATPHDTLPPAPISQRPSQSFDPLVHLRSRYPQHQHSFSQPEYFVSRNRAAPAHISAPVPARQVDQPTTGDMLPDADDFWLGCRQMTLRMTLTKPELRAPGEEEEIWNRTRGNIGSGSNGGVAGRGRSRTLSHRAHVSAFSVSGLPPNDPLALEPLPQMREFEAIPVIPSTPVVNDGCRVRGLWRRVKGGRAAR